MPGEGSAILMGAAALSVAGVLFRLLAATFAPRAADIVGMLGGVVILIVALLHLAPEAIAAGGVDSAFLVAGAAIGIGLEVLFRVRSTQPLTDSQARLGIWLGLLVLSLHSTLDGAVYNAMAWHDHGDGMFASLGLIMHEAPEGVAAMSLALMAGLRPLSAVFVAVLASSLTTPFGWLAAQAIGESGQGVMRPMAAAAAGLLIYVGWHLFSTGLRAFKRT
jgi:zinc and cadmium transporter